MDDRATMYAMFLFENTLEARRAEHKAEIMEREAGRDSGRSGVNHLKNRLKHE